MLDQNVLNEAIGLTQVLSDKGVQLGVIPDTPLALLVRATPTLALKAEETSYSGLIENLVELSREDDHAELLREAVDLASQGVRNTLNYTRNTVMPHLRKVIQAHADRVAAVGEAKMPYNIVASYTPEIYKVHAGVDFARQYENSPAPVTQRLVNLGKLDGNDIVQLTRLTDDGDFNESMEDLLTANGGEGIQAIQKVLEGICTVDQIDPIYSLPLAILLRNMETPKEGVALNLTDYNAARAVVGNAAGKIALTLVERLDHQVRSSVLYAKLLRDDPKTIEVVGEVYRVLLEKGLTAEQVIANELLNRKYRGLTLLEPDVQEELNEIYKRDQAARQQAHQLNLRQVSREAVLNVLRDDQRERAEKGEWVIEGDSPEKSWSRLKTVVDKIYTNSTIDPEPSLVIAAVLCAVWYAHTDAMRYIDIMFDIEKWRPELPKEQIATLAALRYIAEFFGSMIAVHDEAAAAE